MITNPRVDSGVELFTIRRPVIWVGSGRSGKDMGNLLWGAAKGIAAIPYAVYHGVVHPVDSATTVWNVATSPGQVIHAIWSDFYNKAGSLKGQGEIAGEVITTVFTVGAGQAVSGASKAKMIANAAKALDKAADVGDTASDLNRAGNAFGRFGGCFVPGTQVRVSKVPVAMAVPAGTGFNFDERAIDSRPFLSAIENVPLGARVPDNNPQPWDFDFSFDEVDPATWRKIEILLHRADKSVVEIEFLRPESWIEELGLSEGARFNLQLSDTEVGGTATVTAIRPCCEIADGEGHVVTGRFVTRDASNLLEVSLESGTTFVGTSNHPVWLPDRSEWITLEELREGDVLDTFQGSATVTTVRRPFRMSDVYNIEVHGHHVYRITDDGVLVHNKAQRRILSEAEKLDDLPDVPKKVPSANQLNAAIRRGQAPRGIERIDVPKIKGEQLHVHFKDGSALNIDGTWKHGTKALTQDETEWLLANGWTSP